MTSMHSSLSSFAKSPPQDRVISLGNGLPIIPERLLLAHARGQVLFIAGAGVSMPAGLPDFRKLVADVYAKLDKGVHAVVTGTKDHEPGDLSGLTSQQIAEVRRFKRRDYDVVLGMLERRIDDKPSGASRVRAAVAEVIHAAGTKPARIHKALLRLADRGGASAIVTTNFDLLLQGSANGKAKLQTYSLGGIPRPGRSVDFSGILHIHGALDRNSKRRSDLVFTDQDFGEFYMRRRTVPDFIYDAARLFHLVLVGYSADDPPMRYLLNAIAADGVRFDDLKERFTFVGAESPDPVVVEDWKGRGITPIAYDSKDKHQVLLDLLERWAALSAINGRPRKVDAEVKRIVKTIRSAANESDRDLFDHLVRRGSTSERVRLASLASKAGADIGWLDAIAEIASERESEASS
jgi:NAD-dependent SIR2 family protein deacetylase